MQKHNTKDTYSQFLVDERFKSVTKDEVRSFTTSKLKYALKKLLVRAIR